MTRKPHEPHEVSARDRAEWRTWLEAHHDSASGVWLVYNK